MGDRGTVRTITRNKVRRLQLVSHRVHQDDVPQDTQRPEIHPLTGQITQFLLIQQQSLPEHSESLPPTN